MGVCEPRALYSKFSKPLQCLRAKAKRKHKSQTLKKLLKWRHPVRGVFDRRSTATTNHPIISILRKRRARLGVAQIKPSTASVTMDACHMHATCMPCGQALQAHLSSAKVNSNPSFLLGISKLSKRPSLRSNLFIDEALRVSSTLALSSLILLACCLAHLTALSSNPKQQAG
eukprot:5705392-Amphidinium_carterae.1